MTSRLALGTAAIGLEHYGIANRTGKPDDATLEEMLDRALAAGITWIDTAAAYGDAEERLGRYCLPTVCQISTKFPPNRLDRIADVAVATGLLEREYVDACSRLARPEGRLLYLLHTSRDVYRDEIAKAVKRFAVRTRATVGVSCYEPAEVLEATRRGYDAVQVPYSLLDRRCEAAMACAKARGLTVFARAPFCQGLIFLDPDAPEITARCARDLLLTVRREAERHQVSLAELALAFALGCPYADVIVFGAETVQQIIDDVETECRWSAWSSIWGRLRAAIPPDEATIVNPSLWSQP